MLKKLLSLLLCFCISEPAWSAIQFLASGTGTGPAGTVTTGSVNCSGASFAVVFTSGNQTQTITDSTSNATWTLIAQYEPSGYGYWINAYYMTTPTFSATQTFSNSVGGNSMTAMCFSGTKTSSPLDANGPCGNGNIFSTALQCSASFTPAVAGALVVSAGSSSTDSQTTHSISDSNNTFTQRDNATSVNNTDVADAYVIQTSAVGVQPTWTFNASGTFLAVIALAINPAAGGAAVARFNKMQKLQKMEE